MLLIDLEQSRITMTGKQFPWKKCAPFVENSRGTLIHRPRSGTTYMIHRNPHIGVQFWCGMAVTSHGHNLTFTDRPTEGKILCERCEAIAVERGGLPTADELAGRHVHKGRTVAVSTCCQEGGAS